MQQLQQIACSRAARSSRLCGRAVGFHSETRTNGFGFGSVSSNKCGFGFDLKTDPVLNNNNNDNFEQIMLTKTEAIVRRYRILGENTNHIHERLDY